MECARHNKDSHKLECHHADGTWREIKTGLLGELQKQLNELRADFARISAVIMDRSGRNVPEVVCSVDVLAERPHSPEQVVETPIAVPPPLTCPARTLSVESIVQLARDTSGDAFWSDVCLGIEDAANVDVEYLYKDARMSEIANELTGALKADAVDENSVFNYLRTARTWHSSEDVYWAALFLSTFCKRYVAEIPKENVSAKIRDFEHLVLIQESKLEAAPREAVVVSVAPEEKKDSTP